MVIPLLLIHSLFRPTRPGIRYHSCIYERSMVPSRGCRKPLFASSFVYISQFGCIFYPRRPCTLRTSNILLMLQPFSGNLKANLNRSHTIDEVRSARSDDASLQQAPARHHQYVGFRGGYAVSFHGPPAEHPTSTPLLLPLFPLI